MSRRLSLHPFRVQDCTGRIVRFVGGRTIGDESSRRLNKIFLANALTRVDARRFKPINDEAEAMLRRNGFRTGPETLLGRVLLVLLAFLVPVLCLFGIFASLLLGGVILTANIPGSTSLAVVVCTLGILVSVCPFLLIGQVGYKAQFMSERIRLLRCGACDGDTTQRVLENHRTELECTKCGAKWIA